MANPSGLRATDYNSLNIRVETLDSDVREIKDSILGLDAKIEKSISSIAHEMRTSISAISSQFVDSQKSAAERQRTPWAVLISAAGFIVFMLGVFGSQAISPLQADIRLLKEQIVPRDEVNFRSETATRRFIELTEAIQQTRDRRYDEIMEMLRDLRIENRDLKRAK